MVKHDYLISVYITNYNYGEYIKTAIESVLNQSVKNFELIIIDDGSTDNSKEIIDSYAHLPDITIIYQKNKGLNITNNVAMKAANGKYIMRLDADDYLHERALELMSDRLESDPELGLVFPNYYYVDKEGELIGEEKRHDFENEVVLLDQPAHGACTMIRLDFLRKVGGYNEAYTCQDGYELWVKFTQNFKVANISFPLFYYRQHGNNLTGNEQKILKTRALINETFVNEKKFDTSTLAIIPIRGGSQDIAFKSLNGTNLLDLKLREMAQSKNIMKVVVTSPDQQVESLLESISKKNAEFHHRKKIEAKQQHDLNPTIDEIVSAENMKDSKFEIIAVLTLEYPFLEAYKMDDVINTMLVFGSDSIIGVKSDDSVFYQHHGDGLHPILDRDKYTRLEREALFKQVGGITAARKISFLRTKEMVTGNVGHTIMDQKSSFGLFTHLDWEVAEYLEQMGSQANFLHL